MIDNIKKLVRKIDIKKYSKEFLALGVFVVALSIYLITNAFAALTPTKSVIITSEKTSYEENEPGSWQVEKSGKWISKGRARVTFDVDTTLMTEGKDTDIIFVLDISGSMSGDKLDRVKQDSIELIDSLLSNKNNNAALITFDTGSTIVSDFTNDKDYLINEINNLEDTGSTNYYQPLVNVETILKDYVKTDDKEVIVLFLTDGYPNVDVPNQIAQYQTLKKNYPYITINGIQYEMGETILDPIKEISDNQFHADMETLNNVLFDASVAPIPYDEFQIVDYINNDYFILDSVDDITVSQGNVKLEEENGKQKITWTIPYFKTGRDAKLTMDINLKDEYIGQGGIYPTNESEEIISKIVNVPDEDVVSTKTPVLADNYKVIYDGNSPNGSDVSNVPEEANYSVFDTVSISTEEPSCIGYEFKGWEIVNKDVTRVGEDHFIMPEEDVVIRARWSKVEVSKSMTGTVNNMGDPIMKRYTSSTKTDYHSDEYKSKVTSIVTKDNLEIPTTAIEYWDVSEAGDGSVIAYAEDDGSGNGTYKVTIGGQGGVIANKNSSFLFGGYVYNNTNFSSLEAIDLTYLDTSLVTSMSYMFGYCSSLTNIIFGDNFDTSNVTSMSGMFENCRSLTSLDLSNFNTSNVINMGANYISANSWSGSGMFEDCSSLTNIIFGDNFDTSKVTYMANMFKNCSSLTNLNLSNFNTSNVTNMNAMFQSCSSLTSLDVSNFDTSNVTSMIFMFDSCSSLTSLDLSNFDTSNVTDMSYMFQVCSSLTSLDVSSFDTSSVTNMTYMFSKCKLLTNLDVSSFDTSKVTTMGYMFSYCNSLTNVIFSGNFGSFATEMNSMFSGCISLTSLDLSNFDTSKVTDMRSMFSNCSSLTTLDVSSFDTSNVALMGSPNTQANYVYGMFNGCENLITLDLSSWDTSNVIGMGFMFSGCKSLIKVTFGGKFDTSSVNNMSSMFQDCVSLTTLDLSDFDTSNVTNMECMFSSFLSHMSLTNIEFGDTFDTSNVTNMYGMFNNCSSLTSLDLSNFDTSKVTRMNSMFWGCSSLTSLDVSKFDTSQVISMSFMFNGCSSLTSLDMQNADFSSVTSYTSMFSSVNRTINVIVKDSAAQSFIRARLDEYNLSNATVTIAQSKMNGISNVFSSISLPFDKLRLNFV